MSFKDIVLSHCLIYPQNYFIGKTAISPVSRGSVFVLHSYSY
ncbi:MAG: hypothetical protein UHM85_03490 [Acutalibacteraceae bacterium]|nr:hypothetical protein [Acutalibacteraceae bacterium]